MKARRWQWIVSIILTLGIIILAYTQRARIISAFRLVWQADPIWLVAAVCISLLSFGCTSLVYVIGLRSLGYRHFSKAWIYAITVVALILSQSIPAGGVASYAFLAQSLRRRGVPSGHSALLASLEALTYVTSMLLLFGYSLVFLTLRSGVGAAEETSLAAGLVGVLAIGGALFVLTRDRALLARWMLGAKNLAARVFRQQWSDAPILKLVDDLTRGRELVASRPWVLVAMIGVQLLALAGHSLVMLLVLKSLGTTATYQVVLAGFGVVLVTSSFNVLPGGGGTVETVLALTLTGLGVGDEAIPAAVIFRLINFWVMVPVALIFYRWVMHGRVPQVPMQSEAPDAVLEAEADGIEPRPTTEA